MAQEICREYNISQGAFYKWKSKYGGLELSEAKGLKVLEAENARLKCLVADLSLDNVILKDIVSKKF